MITLETQRLILRSFKIEDLDDFYEYAKNPNVGNNGGWKPHETKEESEQLMKRFLEQDKEWAIVWKENNKVIGSISLKDDVKRFVTGAKMIGYSISEDYWGKGIMTETVNCVLEYAFKETEAVLVAVYHFHFNQRSKRVIEKCGFIYEGKMRCSYEMYNGEIYDDYCYSILREEYLLNHVFD